MQCPYMGPCISTMTLYGKYCVLGRWLCEFVYIYTVPLYGTLYLYSVTLYGKYCVLGRWLCFYIYHCVGPHIEYCVLEHWLCDFVFICVLHLSLCWTSYLYRDFEYCVLGHWLCDIVFICVLYLSLCWASYLYLKIVILSTVYSGIGLATLWNGTCRVNISTDYYLTEIQCTRLGEFGVKNTNH